MRLTTIIALAGDSPSANLKMRVHGIPLTIEHPKGTTRVLHNKEGKEVYKVHMMSHYGYINNTKGRDKDETDCMVGPMGDRADCVHVVHMIDKGPDVNQREDEDKVMLGYPSADAAKAAFLAHYPATFFGGMTTLPVKTFKQRLKQTQKAHTHNTIHARFLREGDMRALGRGLKCPECASKKISLMPTDFETAKCRDCGHTWESKK